MMLFKIVHVTIVNIQFFSKGKSFNKRSFNFSLSLYQNTKTLNKIGIDAALERDYIDIFQNKNI